MTIRQIVVGVAPDLVLTDLSMGLANDFYVYQYLRSRDSKHGPAGSPYYIGKGKGRRAFSMQDRTALVPPNKKNIVIVSAGMSETDAFQLEMLLINLHGRIDLQEGHLRNRTDGGDGPSGWVPCEETRKKMSEKAHKRWADLTGAERLELSEARKAGWATLTKEGKRDLCEGRKKRWAGLDEEVKGERRKKQSIAHKVRWANLAEVRKRELTEAGRQR